MTDTLGSPVGPGAGPPMVGGVPAADLSTQITNTSNSVRTGELDPGSIVAVASSGGDTTGKAQALAQAGKRSATATAVNVVKGAGGLVDDLGRDLTTAVGAIAHYANDGLSTVQHEYRYLHDVEARHGSIAAVMEGAGMLAGGIAGGVVAGPEGIALGAEAAGYLEGQVTYKDSYQRTLNPNYRDPHTGQLVSFGRDVASTLGLQGGTKTAVSGALDGLADMFADPLGNVGKGLGAAHSLEGMSGVLGRTYQGLSITADNVEQAFATLPSVRRAFTDIAEHDAGYIASKYPQFQGVVQTLAEANTADEVKDVFKELAASNEVLDAQKLPTLGFMRQNLTQPFRDMARNAGEGPISQLDNSLGTIAQRFANNALIGPRRWADRLESLPGATFDPKTMDFSGSQINPSNTRGVVDLMRLVRYSGSQREAEAIGSAYAAATPAQRIVIVKNTIMRTLFSMAKMPLEDGDDADSLLELIDGRTKQAIKERLENHLGAAEIEGSAPTRVFGVGTDGKVIRPVLDDEGVAIQGAIRANQTGNLSIPNIVEARRMAQAINAGRTSRILSGVDDFLYDHVTQGFFKPLVLMSGGYGLHISMAELIPNTLRHGLGETFTGLYNRALATLGYKASEGELEVFGAWLYRVAGYRALENSQDAQYLMEVYLANEGYKTTAGLAAGEITQGEIQPVEKAIGGFRQNMAMGTKEGSIFSTFGNESARFTKLWRSSLREAANDRWTQTAAKVYLQASQEGVDEETATEAARAAVARQMEAEPQDIKDFYVRMQRKSASAPAAWSPIDDHAQAVVDAMKGDITGKEGTLHVDLLRNVVNGRTPDLEELDAIDPSLRPAAVKGREVIPEGNGAIQRIANFGFRKILNPMVNFISRNEEFAIEYVQARRVLQPQVDQGLMTDDEAMVRAEAQATNHAMRFVHNLHDRTQWTATMRNWAPFYFAQEQAYRRMGRLLAEDPGAFRRYQMMITGIGHVSAQMRDGSGNSYIAFPGSGFIGSGVADAMGLNGITLGGVTPAAFGGSLSSANVIFPLSQGFKPDLGPVAIIPAQTLSTFFIQLGTKYPKWAPITNVPASGLDYITGNSGSQEQSILEQLIPNAFLERVYQLYAAKDGNDRAFNSTVMQAYQFIDYQQNVAMEKWEKDGRKGPAPQLIPPQTAPASVRQEFADKIRSYVQWLYVARAITGLVSPVSSEVEITNFGFPQKLNDAISKAGSVSAGMQNFLLENPNATPYTVAQSYVPANFDQTQSANISLSSSFPAMQWIDQNQALLNQYGVSALWLMPQLKDAKYSPTVYNEQIAQGLRVKDTPQQFLNALYVAAGDDVYYNGLTVHENALAAAGNSTAAKEAEYSSWDSWVANLEKAYPIWAENFNSGTKQTDRQDAISALTQIFENHQAPPGEQSSLVEQLLQQYYVAAQAYQQAGATANYSTEQKDVNDSWIQYLDNLAQSTPQLKPVIQSVFKDALKVNT